MEATDNEIKKALVFKSVEKVLLNIGEPVLEEVTGRLYENYKCHLPDCYEHPEYLARILKDLFGAVHLHIIKLINKELEEFSYQKPIEAFLNIIRE
ncbi:MAG: hypothetical protein HY222_04300 [Thaumarchaeota archaeon]|nr:hypothetical protein [Nitrososphaerota archaeon]MBI3641596.1 hypothetical protein [Nitrososphaerota archaeon]